MKPTKGKKIIIPHFKGVNDYFLEKEKADLGFARKSLGVIDAVGGHLCKIPGKVSATTNSYASIWSLAQLRFAQHWNILVHAGSNRLHYEHDPFDIPIIPDSTTPDPPPDGPGPDPIPLDGPTPPPPSPIYCHSWWYPLYGYFSHSIHITDMVVYYRYRNWGTGWVTAINQPSCAAAWNAEIAAVIARMPTLYWANWVVGCPPLGHAPNGVSRLTLSNPWNWCVTPWCCTGAGVPMQWTVRSAQMAAINPDAYDPPIENIIVTRGSMRLIIHRSNLANPWWTQTPQNSPAADYVGLNCPNRSADMIFKDATIDALANIAGDYSCSTSPPSVPYNYFTGNVGDCGDAPEYIQGQSKLMIKIIKGFTHYE